MMNWDLVDDVIDNVIFICQKRGIGLDKVEIKKRTVNWYNHTDYCDVDSLSALVLHSDYTSEITYAELPEIKIKYFNELKV